MAYKLLLADDSITIQRVIELTFLGEAIEVVAVRDGADAIARLPQERPDIVLADISMPGASGYEVAAFVRNSPDLSHVPVLLLAGAFEPVDESLARAARSDGVLVKPFEPQQVVMRVRELLERGRSGPGAGAASGGALPRAVEGTPHGAGLDEGQDEGQEAWVDEESSHPGVPPPTEPAATPDRQPLDDYFEQLNEALSTVTARQAGTAPPAREPSDEGVSPLPTLDDLLAGTDAFAETPEAPVAGAPRLAPEASPPVAQGALADAFGQLLAVEAGEPGAVPPRLSPAGRQPASDELIERVVARVIERLSPDAARAMVTPIVTEVAERLVREELARLHAARGGEG